MTDEQINLAIGAITHAEHIMDFPDVILDALDSVIAFLATMDEQPERKKGRWYKPTGMMPPEYAGRHRCSECDGFAMHDWKTHREVLTDFCPWCGADMREGGE